MSQRNTANQPSRDRLHYIVEWAEKRGLKQADIVREIEVDKGSVSRWFHGTLPSSEHLRRLAALLTDGDVTSLFRHPDDDWLSRMLRGRTEAERNRIRRILEALIDDEAA